MEAFNVSWADIMQEDAARARDFELLAESSRDGINAMLKKALTISNESAGSPSAADAEADGFTPALAGRKRRSRLSDETQPAMGSSPGVAARPVSTAPRKVVLSARTREARAAAAATAGGAGSPAPAARAAASPAASSTPLPSSSFVRPSISFSALVAGAAAPAAQADRSCPASPSSSAPTPSKAVKKARRDGEGNARTTLTAAAADAAAVTAAPIVSCADFEASLAAAAAAPAKPATSFAGKVASTVGGAPVSFAGVAAASPAGGKGVWESLSARLAAPAPEAAPAATDAAAAPASPAVPIKPLDEHRLAQRQKQIDLGKSSASYQAYLAAVPKEARKAIPAHPVTPDRAAKISMRRWRGRINAWRVALHAYDPAGTAPPAMLEGGDDGEGEEDMEEEEAAMVAPTSARR